MGKDMQFSPLNFLIGSGGPELISNNNNDTQKLDEESGDEVDVEKSSRGYNGSAEHDMMTALGLSFTAAAQQNKGAAGGGGPTADVMAALGLSYSGHSGIDSVSPVTTAIKSEVVVDGVE